MADNKKSTNLGLGGAVIGITGGILCYVGKQMDNNLKEQIPSILRTGSKDGTGEALFYIGIGLVIIGVIMIVINIIQYYQPDSRGINNDSNNSEASYKYVCSKCKTTIKKGMQVCPNCGKELNWSRLTESQAMLAETDKSQQRVSTNPDNTAPKQFCTNCGAKLVEGNKFCGCCGAKVN